MDMEYVKDSFISPARAGAKLNCLSSNLSTSYINLDKGQEEAAVASTAVWGSRRLVVMVCCFLSLVTNFSGQTLMTSAMVCMIANEGPSSVSNVTNTSPTNGSGSSASLPHENPWRHSWDPKTSNWILSSFFVLYYLGQMPSGFLAQRPWNKKMVVLGQATSGLMQLLTVPATMWGIPYIIVMRLLGGLFSSLLYPNTMAMLANWTPRHETSIVVGSVGVGMEAGNLLSFSLSIFACQIDVQGGWPFVFYCQSGVQLLVMIAFLTLAHDSPASHPSITQEEKDYLLASTVQREHKAKTPIRAIVTSLPVIALTVCKGTSLCAYFLFVILMPQYVKNVLKLPTLQVSILFSLPFLVIFPSVVGLGKLADHVVLKGVASNTTVRKGMDFCSKILYSVFLMVMGHLPEGSWPLALATNVGIVFSLGICYLSYEVNSVDLSPPHTGFICAFAQASTYWVNIVIPIVVGIITQDGSRESWQNVFYIVVGIQIVGVVFYMTFGSGELQPWARQDDQQSLAVPADSSKTETTHKQERILAEDYGELEMCSSSYKGRIIAPSLPAFRKKCEEKAQLLSRH